VLIADPAPLLAAVLLALLLDAALGDPMWLHRRIPHPVVLIGRTVEALERRLRHPRGSPGGLVLSGGLAVLLVVGGAALIGALLQAALHRLPHGWIGEGVLIATLLAWGSLVDHVRRVADGLEQGLGAGREAVRLIVGRDPDGLDAHAVARAAIESAAENFSDGLTAPLLFALLAGLPGILAYKSINTLDSMIGHRTPRHLHFGRAAARLDDLVNLVPARLSGLLIALAALLMPGGRPGRALAAMGRDARHHRSPNAGWPEAALAGALGFRLAGPRAYGGRMVEDAWMGDGCAELGPADIRLSLRLLWRVWLLLVLLVAALLALA
jgi:adenosylcobinamide-phosphate synthase